LNDYINHPAITNLKVEDLDLAIEQAKLIENSKQNASNQMELQMLNTEDISNKNDQPMNSAQLSKIRIFVGNVSKSLNTNNSQIKQKASQINSINEDESISCSIKSSQYNQDLITHKWMVYIRTPNCSRIESYIKKVVFYLHFSYKPYDVVEVK
jgi:transcription initiation factor IIF auxiliary subunit